MTTTSPKIDLILPDDPDNVDVDIHISGNFTIIDELLPSFVCTSLTRPGSPFQGMQIYETNTGYHRVWNDVSDRWDSLNIIDVVSTDARPSGPLLGDRLFESDTGITRLWNGTRWAPVGLGLDFYSESLVANTNVPNAVENSFVGNALVGTDLFGAYPFTFDSDGSNAQQFEFQVFIPGMFFIGTPVEGDDIAIY